MLLSDALRQAGAGVHVRAVCLLGEASGKDWAEAAKTMSATKQRYGPPGKPLPRQCLAWDLCYSWLASLWATTTAVRGTTCGLWLVLECIECS